MTKLYSHAGSWQLPGQQDKGAERVDVPSAPAELAAWLNARRVPVAGDAFDGLVPGNAPARELLDALREPAGTVLTAGDVEKVNDTRPEFLPRLTADEIERRRLAMSRCPKCGSAPPSDIGRVLAWIETASIDNLQTVAEAIRTHVQELGEQLEERSVQ